MSSPPILLTIAEAAARLGVTARRARVLAASGRIEGAVKIGRDWLIPALASVTPGTRGPRLRAAAGTTRRAYDSRPRAGAKAKAATALSQERNAIAAARAKRGGVSAATRSSSLPGAGAHR